MTLKTMAVDITPHKMFCRPITWAKLKIVFLILQKSMFIWWPLICLKMWHLNNPLSPKNKMIDVDAPCHFVFIYCTCRPNEEQKVMINDVQSQVVGVKKLTLVHHFCTSECLCTLTVNRAALGHFSAYCSVLGPKIWLFRQQEVCYLHMQCALKWFCQPVFYRGGVFFYSSSQQIHLVATVVEKSEPRCYLLTSR